MADAKISDLAATTSLADTDEIEVASSGTSKKITGANLRADLVGSLPTVASATHAATSKATPVDADEIPLTDSAASFALKKLTWANLKATLKTYFDTLYPPSARSISAGTGLSGGGDLSADRTLAVSYGTTAGTAAQGNDSRLSDSRTPSGSAGGDLTGTYPNPTLAAAGPGATGPIGDATHSAAVTIDAKGRVTGLTSVAITGAPPSGAAGGDLAGTYPDPTLAVIGAATGPIGDATHVPAVTIDAKGRVTGLTSVSIQIAESQVTNLTTDLAAKVDKSTFDANTILKADSDNTPAALELTANTFPARASTGSIAAKTITDAALSVLDDTTVAAMRTTLGVGASAKLFDSTLGAAANSIDTGANGIGSDYDVLEVWIFGRTDEAVVSSSAVVTINGDTGNNYDRIIDRTQNTTGSGSISLARANWDFNFPGTSVLASYFGVIRLTIPCYAQTTGFKTGEATKTFPDSTAANVQTDRWGIGWRSTAAINQLTVTAAAGKNFIAGSRLLIYGR